MNLLSNLYRAEYHKQVILSSITQPIFIPKNLPKPKFVSNQEELRMCKKFIFYRNGCTIHRNHRPVKSITLIGEWQAGREATSFPVVHIFEICLFIFLLIPKHVSREMFQTPQEPLNTGLQDNTSTKKISDVATKTARQLIFSLSCISISRSSHLFYV